MPASAHKNKNMYYSAAPESNMQKSIWYYSIHLIDKDIQYIDLHYKVI